MLLSDPPFAVEAARVIKGESPGEDAHQEYEDGEYESEIHQAKVHLPTFHDFLKEKYLEEMARDGYTFGDIHLYDHTYFLHEHVITAVGHILDPSCQVDYRNVKRKDLDIKDVLDSFCGSCSCSVALKLSGWNLWSSR